MFDTILKRFQPIANNVSQNATTFGNSLSSGLSSVRSFFGSGDNSNLGPSALNQGGNTTIVGPTSEKAVYPPSNPSGSIIPTANAQTIPAPVQPAGYAASPQPSLGGAVATPDQAQQLAQSNPIPPVGRIAPLNFSTGTQSSYPSTALNTSTTYQDLLDRYDQLAQSVNNGTSGATPTDAYMNQVYSQSLYTPDEQNALGQYADVTNRINQTTLAERRQIQQLQEDGTITKEQGASFLSESQRRADQQLADLGVQQQGAALSLQVLGQIRGNNLQALQNLSPFYTPQQVSPGSTLANAQGQTFFQGSGAAPATIVAQASTLAQQDSSLGQLKLNSQGQIDYGYYMQQASSMLGNPSGFGQTSYNAPQQYSGSSASGGAPSAASGAQGGQFVTSLGSTLNSQDSQRVNALPQAYQSYVEAGPLGVGYINSDRVPANQLANVQSFASKAGIPVLTTQEVQGVQSLQVTFEGLDAMSNLAQAVLSPGLSGRLQGLTLNQAAKALQTGPNVTDPLTGQTVPIGVLLGNFDQYRDSAIKAVQALAGGAGSGLRLNTDIINTAANNLPTSSDSSDSAAIKIATFQNLLMNQLKVKFPSIGSPNTIAPSGSSGGASVIQSSVGPINPNF